MNTVEKKFLLKKNFKCLGNMQDINNGKNFVKHPETTKLNRINFTYQAYV